MSGAKSHYIYFQADAARDAAGRYDAYLAVEYFDDQTEVARVRVRQGPAGSPRRTASMPWPRT